MRTTSPPPHKQDNGMDRTHKAMSPRMYRDNHHDRDNSGGARLPASGDDASSINGGDRPADAPPPDTATSGRFGTHHDSSDQDKRGYERAYQREHNNIGRYERSAHDLQKDGRQSRDD